MEALVRMGHARSSLAVRPPVAHTSSAEPAGRPGILLKVPAWLSLRTWQGRLIWLLLLIGPAWWIDRPLYQARMPGRKVLLLGDIRDVSRQFGEPVAIAWIGTVIWLLDPSRRRPLIVAVVATTIAATIGSSAKILIGRERPKVSQGLTVVRGPHWPGSMDPDPSFPSGHTTVAFAFAYGLTRLYGNHCTLWLAFAAGCGISRSLGAAHFLTDVLVGAWLGWEIARLVWSGGIARILRWRMDRRLPNVNWLPPWDWKVAV